MIPCASVCCAAFYFFNETCASKPSISLRASPSVQVHHTNVVYDAPKNNTNSLLSKAHWDRASHEDALKRVLQLKGDEPWIQWTETKIYSWECSNETWSNAVLHFQVHAHVQVLEDQNRPQQRISTPQIVETHIGYFILPLCDLSLLGASQRFALLVPANHKFALLLDLQRSGWGRPTRNQPQPISWSERRKIQKSTCMDVSESLHKVILLCAEKILKLSNQDYFLVAEGKPWSRSAVRLFQNSFVDVTCCELYELPSAKLISSTAWKIPGAWFVATLTPTVGMNMPSLSFFESCLSVSLLQMNLRPDEHNALHSLCSLDPQWQLPSDSFRIRLLCELLARMGTSVWRPYLDDAQDTCPISLDGADASSSPSRFQMRVQEESEYKFNRHRNRMAGKINHPCSLTKVDYLDLNHSSRDQKQHVMQNEDEYYGILGSRFTSLAADDCESLSTAVMTMMMLLSLLIRSGRVLRGTLLWIVAYMAEQYIPLYTSCAAMLESGDERSGGGKIMKAVLEGYESSHEQSLKTLKQFRPFHRKRYLDVDRSDANVNRFPYHVVVTLVERKRFRVWNKRGRALDRWADEKASRYMNKKFIPFEELADVRGEPEMTPVDCRLPTLVLESTECSPAIQDVSWLTEKQRADDQAELVFFEWLDQMCPFGRFFRYKRPVAMVHMWDMYQTMVSAYTSEPWFTAVTSSSSELSTGELVFVDCKTGLRGVKGVDYFKTDACIGTVVPGIQKIDDACKRAFQMFMETQPSTLLPIGATLKERKEHPLPVIDRPHAHRVWLRAEDWNVIEEPFSKWCKSIGMQWSKLVVCIEHNVEVVYLDLL